MLCTPLMLKAEFNYLLEDDKALKSSGNTTFYGIYTPENTVQLVFGSIKEIRAMQKSRKYV